MASTRFGAGALFLGCAALFALTGGGRARTVDEHVLLAQSESLTRGSLAIPQAVDRGTFFGRIGVEGQPYGAFSPGWSLLAVPFTAAGRGAASLWELETDQAVHAVMAVSASWLNALAAAATVTFVWLLLVEAGYPRRRVALPVALAAGLTTPLWVYAGSLFTEPVSAAALAAAAWGGMRWRRRSAGSLAIAGTGVAVLVMVNLTHVVLVPVLVFAVIWVQATRWERLRAAAWILVPALAIVVAHLALNFVRFGDAFESSYPTFWNGRAFNTFDTPLWIGLLGLTLSPGKGMALFAPLSLLATVFVRPLTRRHEVLALYTLAPVGTLLAFHMTHTQWEGGFCFGPRVLVPALPLLLLPLAELLQKMMQARRHLLVSATLALALSGAWVQVAGVTTNWFAAPRDRDTYYDERFTYRMTYAPVLTLSRRVGQGLAQLSRSRPTRARLLNNWRLNLSDAGVPASLSASVGAVAFAGLFAGAVLATRAVVARRREE